MENNDHPNNRKNLNTNLEYNNYQKENFAVTEDVMVISNLEEKMTNDFKGVFYGKNKVYLFINKASGAQEGQEVINLASKFHRNFNVPESEEIMFNELYGELLVVKLTNKINALENRTSNLDAREVYLYVIDLLDAKKYNFGIERLRSELQQGNLEK